MATNIYLQVEFGSGNLYQFSKDAKEGFEEHLSKNNKLTYRRYFKEGIYGVYRGTTVRKTDFGKEVSIHMINVNGDNVYINFPLNDQKKNIAAYAKSFITVLPTMQMNYVYRIFPYAMDREGTEYKNYGVSVRHADMHNRTVREDFPLDRLTFAYVKKDGEKVDGDIPAVTWVKAYDGTMQKNSDEQNAYLYNVLMEHAEERTSGASNKVTSDTPPQPYTGGFDNGTSTTPTPEPSAKQTPAPAPAPTPEAKEEAPAAKPAPAPAPAPAPQPEANTGGETDGNTPSAKKKKVDLPF
jgi:hypothetical protein